MSSENVVRLFGNADVMQRLEEINRLADFEEQGYQSAPILAQLLDMKPGELALRTLTTCRADDVVANYQRTLGLIRWCLDNRH